ncbi:c-type cytochrome [Methylobacterium sp. CM6257]
MREGAMGRKGRNTRMALGGLMVLLACPACASDGGEIARSGTQTGAPACAACHGDDGGGSVNDGFPRLAGLTVGYLTHELDSFGDGSRENETMGPIAQLLTSDERRAVAAYYAGLSAPRTAEASAPDGAISSRGRSLAEEGDWSRGLPSCGQCHGPAGQGVGAAFPALAGQPAAYLSSQLSAWKAGTRHNDPLGLMKGIADKLSDQDVAAVSAHYGALPATQVGGKQ